MWEVYFAFGYHEIRQCTNEEFEELRKFYHLKQIENDRYINSRGDIHAWRKAVQNERENER